MVRGIRHLLGIGLVIIATVLLLAACGGDDDEPDTTPAPEFTAQPTAPPVPPTATRTPRPTPLPQPVTDSNPRTGARLRIVHASPDLPAVNIFLDGANIGRGFTYGLYHNAPLGFAPGTYRLRIVAAGDDPDIADAVLEQDITLEGGSSLLAVINGPPDDPQIIIQPEDLSPMPTGTARISVLNVVQAGAPYTVQEANQTISAEVEPGTAGEAALLPATRHDFDFTLGTDIVHAVDLNLSEQVVYTLILAGDAAADAYTVIDVRSDAEKETEVRFIQASLDMPLVDVYLDDILLGDALAYRDTLEWRALPSYTYQLRLVPAGDSDAEPLFTRDVALKPNAALSLIALDTFERLRLITLEEATTPTPTNGARLTFVHAALGVDSVTIETLGGPIPGLTPLSFGTISNPVMLATGETAFYIATNDPNDPVTVDYIESRDWSAGTQYVVVITNNPDNEPMILTHDVGIEQTVLGDTGEILPIEAETDEEAQPGEAAGFAEQLRIRVVNVLADAGPLDVIIDGQPIFENIPFGGSTVYAAFSDLPREVTIRASTNELVLVQDDLPLAGIADLTLFVYRDAGTVTYEITPDTSTTIAGGQARLRMVHFAPEKPAYYLAYLPAATEDAGTPVGDATEYLLLLDPVEPRRIGEAQGVPTGTYAAQLREADTDILQENIDITLESGVTYDLILLPDSSGLGVVPIVIRHRE